MGKNLAESNLKQARWHAAKAAETSDPLIALWHLKEAKTRLEYAIDQGLASFVTPGILEELQNRIETTIQEFEES